MIVERYISTDKNNRNGSLHEYMGHDCAKSSLAFRKPAVAAASRRPARADGPKGRGR